MQFPQPDRHCVTSTTGEILGNSDRANPGPGFHSLPRTRSAFLAAFLAFLVGAAIAAAPQFVTVGWFYPDSGSDIDCFKIYSSGDLAVPLAQWKLALTVPGSNLVADVPVYTTKAFYYVTASNFLGESTPSNTLRVPGWTNVTGLTVKGVK
jgi:hypothetical protein